MSKISAKLDHQIKLKNRLRQIQQYKDQEISSQINSLQGKIRLSESRKNKYLQEKIKNCKNHQEIIQKKRDFLQQKYIDSIELAEKKRLTYDKQYKSYLQSKKSRISKKLRVNCDFTQNLKSERNQNSYSTCSIPHILNKSMANKRKVNFAQSIKKQFLPRSRIQTNLADSAKTLMIQHHKQKSQRLKQQKSDKILYQIIQKLQKIKLSRQKVQKNVLIQFEKRKQRIRFRTQRKQDDNREQLYDRIKTLEDERKRKYEQKGKYEKQQRKRLIKNKSLNAFQAEFNNRGNILKEIIEKNKKTRILKKINTKINQFKIMSHQFYV